MGYIGFSLLAVLMPFNFMWAIIYGTASTGAVVLAGLTVKHFRDAEWIEIENQAWTTTTKL